VLHLPGYTFAKLADLAPGAYAEQCYFEIPAGKSLSGRRHTVGLYKKDKHLTFFARPGYLLREL
jgi:hypothetical protein